ncbi:putative restriction-modification system specificity determinant [Candidatus Vecturithrix granuli]|uniref:Putative restriction-modification system specificity determinant n=1 Tax=Vecturithrix granuli TaxID=1499967 RepID=A0A0S6W5I6_VECG1|nr:putative restriction-modification system specificity determinant [Candidatus Vecturithrix granuli]
MSHNVLLANYIEEIRTRLRNQQRTVYSVTNTKGFVPSLDVFDKQVFSTDISNYKLVAQNDLAYNPSRINVGSVAICPDPQGGAVSPMYVIVRCKNGLLPAYLLHFLKSDVGLAEINLRTEGAVRFQLKFKDLQRIPIYLPSKEEQTRIVRLLDEADALRRLRARADTRMAAFIPALFHEMFGDPVLNEKGWPLVLVSSFVHGFEAGKSILTEGIENPKSQYRVLKVSAVTWKNYQPEESKPVPPDYNPLIHHIVRKGDLLFSRANTTQLVGATAFVFETPPNILLPDKLWRFVWEEPLKIDPLFVWSLFLHPSIRYELGSRATGTSGSMKNISMQKVLSMKAILPPLALQHEFAARVQAARVIQAQQAASRARLEALFQSMLARAFAGEL